MIKTFRDFKKQCFDVIGNQCAHCGSSENLQIDHIDFRTKNFDISKKWGSKDFATEIRSELAKCQPLCQQCHRLKSAEDIRTLRADKPIVHGNMYAWMKRKCECEVCLFAKRTWYDTRNQMRRNGKGYPRQPRVCGTRAMYKYGCKCAECRRANTQYTLALRKKNMGI